MPTCQIILDRGRAPLNDAAKTRWPDATLLVFLNDFMKLARRVRPDLLFGTFTVAWADLVVGDPFPLDVEYEPIASDYITGRAEALGTEDELEQRAIAFLKSAGAGLGAT